MTICNPSSDSCIPDVDDFGFDDVGEVFAFDDIADDGSESRVGVQTFNYHIHLGVVIEVLEGVACIFFNDIHVRPEMSDVCEGWFRRVVGIGVYFNGSIDALKKKKYLVESM